MVPESREDGMADPEDDGAIPPTAGSAADRRAWIERLIREHHGELYRYAFRLSGSQADAEDITQQVFLSVCGKLDQLRDEGKVRGWMFAIARTCFLKSRRRIRPMPVSDIDLEIDLFVDPQTTVEDWDIEGIDGESLTAALGQLHDETRVMLAMFYFEEASYREIAEALGIPAGTVMSRLSRAKEKLRRLLVGGRRTFARE
ncbi:MAG: sigma-70 family RNA polymerase sigma factor [Planctomycetes bacterium]|nr:sigma-70 family RNA polymerase sigma factor [Planctomycetota bacterium]